MNNPIQREKKIKPVCGCKTNGHELFAKLGLCFFDKGVGATKTILKYELSKMKKSIDKDMDICFAPDAFKNGYNDAIQDIKNLL